MGAQVIFRARESTRADDHRSAVKRCEVCGLLRGELVSVPVSDAPSESVPGRQSAMTELVEHGQLFIGGELTDPLGKDVIEVISPHTEEVIGRVPHASVQDVDRAVAVARRAFDEGPWPRMTLDERIEVVTRIKDGIAVRHEEIARVISSENGSPYSWSI